MFRNLAVAALAVLALSSVGIGTASAAEPHRCPDGKFTNSVAECDTSKTSRTEVKKDAPLVNAPLNVLGDQENKDVQKQITESTSPTKPAVAERRGNFAACQQWQDRGPGDKCVDRTRGNHYGGHFYNDRFEGRYLIIDGFAQRNDVCAYNSYNDYAGRYGTYRGRVDAMFGNGSKWDSIRRVNNCSVSTQVVDNGDCTTYVTSANNYVRYRDDWNRTSRDYRNRGIKLSVGSRELLNLQTIQRERDRWRGDYDRNRSRVLSTHTTCNNAPVVNNITYEAPPVNYVTPAPAPVAAAPAPLSTQLQTVPSGSASTGDGSTEK
jgi:hypothetical protein